ncbi:ubiquitin-like protein 7 [Ctenocephalides felis]|nr:ubiquitin-like protein 7 [Ctenocephalides felis]
MPSMSSLMAESDSDSSGSENFSVGFPAHRTNSESNSRITSNQLSAALAFASNTSNSNTPTNSVPTTSSSSSSLIRSPSSIITSSMFSNALRNAMRQVRDTNRVTPSSQTENRNENSNLAIQLNRMRELGLTDDAINLQALVICNNDVQAAINLVLSGAIGNTD